VARGPTRRHAVALALPLVLCARCPGQSAAQATAGLLLPVRPSCITSPFGPRGRVGPHAFGFHNGIDLRAPSGGAVYAAAAGNVTSIHRRGPGGLEITLQHLGQDGAVFTTLYAHLGSVAPPLAGGRRAVAAGEKLGVVGRSGVTYGTHLYFEVLINGHPVDPEPLLPAVRCAGQSVSSWSGARSFPDR
jgi:murein DD-endopeptidase MepM/ murein hydrolase activator NlpD